MKLKITILLLMLSYVVSLMAQEVGQTYEPIPGVSGYSDVSRPLTEIGPIPPKGASGHHLHKKGKEVPQLLEDPIIKNAENALPKGEDPVWQKFNGSKGMSGTIENFEGTRNSDNGPPAQYVAPPDTDGDVGPNHYVQMCNTIFQIFDKQGNTLFGPADNSTIWDGFIGAWTGTNDGDPIVLYDEHADRWLVSQFAVNTGSTFWILVAISTTSDPTGSYYRYAFQFASYPDYPKFGIWRDGYYLMTQHGNGSVTVAALNRNQMLVGTSPAQMVQFNAASLPGGGFIGMLPSDNDGQWAPVGAPNYFAFISDDAWGNDPFDRLKIWEFDVNWANTALSTFTLTNNINTAAFSSAFGSFLQGIIPQQGSAQRLEVMEPALMNRLQYRNFGSYESMVCCHTVDVDGANRAGTRWYELRKDVGAWYIYQQGTYSPGNTDNYWMGSIAQNGDGDIALGFSVSSSSRFPSIHYTGRNPNDPLGQMTLGEKAIIEGAFAQGGVARWGDYSMMSVDPTDDETFWYTNEYAGNYNAWGAWITQIASFNLGNNCAASGGCDEYISSVQFGSINNSSLCTNYGDYTNLVNNIPINAIEKITVTNGSGYSADQCGVWVDWNRDGDFIDANETIAVSGNPGAGPYTAYISVPAGQTYGECIVRVRITFSGAVSPCGSTLYGEVEDYKLNVTGPADNVWTGTVSNNWHDAANWSLLHTPYSTDNVVIPDGTPYKCWIYSFNGACNNLTIASGTYFRNYDVTLTVNGDLNVNGQLMMDNSTSSAITQVEGTINWNSGSTAWTADLTIIKVAGDWNFNAGASANIGGGVMFFGSSNSFLRTYDADCSLMRYGNYKPAGNWVSISNASTAQLTINDVFYNQNNAATYIYSNYPVIIKGEFYNNGHLYCGAGTVVFDGTTHSVEMNAGDYFNNLTVSSSGSVFLNTNTDINGNVLIESGILVAGSYTINVAGNWTNTAGLAAFNEGTSRVIFDGAGHQLVKSNETFNIIEAKMGAALRLEDPAGFTVTCNHYDWTTGGIDVIAGTFTALNLTDNGIWGGFWLNAGGTINLTSSGWIDLNANMNIYGGTFNVYGGTLTSDWPYSANASITMSGGVLDFKNRGINVNTSSGFTLTENITGGTIRTVAGFENQRLDFTPYGSTIEMYGTTDAFLTTGLGCMVYNVTINKGADDDGTTFTDLYDREGKPIEQTRSSTAFAGSSPVTILGSLNINSGTFDMNARSVNVTSNVNINAATLKMVDPTDNLTANRIYWYAGSNDNVTSGVFNANEWGFWDGTNAQLGTGNTAFVKFLYFPTDLDAEFGNLVAKSNSKTLSDKGRAYYPIRVAGGFTLESTVNWDNMAYDLIVAGNSTIESGGAINFVSGADFYASGNLVLVGTIALGTGSVVNLDGAFSFPLTGILNVGTGTFTNNYTTNVTNLSGTLQLTTGTVEFPNSGIAISGTFNDIISGGLFRVGKTFSAPTANSFQPTGGTIEFVNASAGNYVQVVDNNFLFNVILNKPGSSLQVYDNLTIKGDLTINAGVLNSNNRTIAIAGDWTNNAGVAGFDETAGRVIFNGSDVQFCNTENFNILEINKPSNLLYNTSVSVINCQVYDWTSGGLWISPGNFNAADLADNGLYGTFAIFNGTMNLYQDNLQYVDINGNITVGSGGNLNVYGGNGDSYWPFDGNANVTISGGVLDFKNVGINIYNSASYTLTENIIGGVIKTTGNFAANNAVFTPTGGILELYGDISSNIYMTAGSNLFGLAIFKTGLAKDNEPVVYSDHNGKIITLTRGNQVTLASDVFVNGALSVWDGILSLGNSGFDLTSLGAASIENGGKLEILSGSQLKLNNSMTVKSGGTLTSTGIVGTEAVITRAAVDKYSFLVQSGGNIGASNTIFEYMGATGINIASGAVVDPAQAFNSCTFRQGLAGNTLFTMNSTQDLTCTGAIFPANVWGGASNVTKATNAGRITFKDFSGAFSGSAFENDIYNRVDWFVPQLSASPLTLNVNPPAGTTTFNITSNLAWTVSESSTWFSVNTASGSNNATITVTFDQNTSASSRSANITISGAGVADVIVTVVQAGATLSVLPATQNVTAAAGTTTFNVTSNTAWTVAESVSWFTVLPMSGSGNGTLTVTYDQNASLTTRSGQITVSSTGLTNVVVTVNQAGVTPTLTVTPSNRDVIPPAGTTTFGVTSNTGWTVSESATWLSVAPASGTGNGTITVTYDQNTTTAARSANIVLTATGGTPTQTVTVTQAGATLSVLPASQNVTAPAGTTTFGVTSNTIWTASESTAWFTIAPSGGTGNNTITVTYEQNSSVTARSGQITISSTGLPNVMVTVNQAGAGATLSVLPANRDVTPPASTTTFTLTSNTGWTVSEAVSWLSVLPLSGSGNGTLTVTYNENAIGSPRVGNITVTATGGSPATTVTVTQASYPTHSVALSDGWQGLSSYIMPSVTNLPALFTPVAANFNILQNLSGVYYPSGGINTIGVWASQSAYSIKMSAASTLPIIGPLETNKTFALGNGWNLMPVICNTNVTTSTLVSGLGANLGIIKEIAGSKVYWPAFGIYTLNQLTPGKAYYVRMTAAGSVTFPANAADNGFIHDEPIRELATPWNEIHRNAASHILGIEAQAMTNLTGGDIIGAFTTNGLCIGNAVIGNITENQSLYAFADDQFTSEADGFTDGQPMIFKLFRPSTGEEFNLEVVYSSEMPNNDGLFATEGISAIKGLSILNTGLTENFAKGLYIYPNPTTSKVTIGGINGIEQILVMASDGSIVMRMNPNADGNQVLDLSALPAGFYQVQVRTSQGVVTRKVVKGL